jgi:hypothetical protein
MLERASRPLARAPVRSRLGCRRWDLGPLQFVRDTSPNLLDHVPCSWVPEDVWSWMNEDMISYSGGVEHVLPSAD